MTYTPRVLREDLQNKILPVCYQSASGYAVGVRNGATVAFCWLKPSGLVVELDQDFFMLEEVKTCPIDELKDYIAEHLSHLDWYAPDPTSPLESLARVMK